MSKVLIAERKNKKIYRDGDKCIKRFSKDFSKADVLNEALNHARVEETGIFIPKLYEVSKIDGMWSIVMDFIEGNTIRELIEQNPEKLEYYLEMFLDIQVSIHSKKSQSLTKQKEKLIDKIDISGLSKITKYDLQTRLLGMPVHNKVCHGDFSMTNVIIDKEGQAFVIDWAHATCGNASADAAKTYLLFCLYNEEVAKMYLDLFCKKTKTKLEYVKQWLPIVAASQLEKGREEEKNLLMSWATIFDYE